MAFSDLIVRIKGDITDFGKKMKDASALATSEAKKINDSLDRATKKSKFEFKDVGRIVQGIMISKAFYGGLNAIRNCTDAVINFSTQLEYAHMTYENMFGILSLLMSSLMYLRILQQQLLLIFLNQRRRRRGFLRMALNTKTSCM